jgi:hypothetical protein
MAECLRATIRIDAIDEHGTNVEIHAGFLAPVKLGPMQV